MYFINYCTTILLPQFLAFFFKIVIQFWSNFIEKWFFSFRNFYLINYCTTIQLQVLPCYENHFRGKPIKLLLTIMALRARRAELQILSSYTNYFRGDPSNLLLTITGSGFTRTAVFRPPQRRGEARSSWGGAGSHNRA